MEVCAESTHCNGKQTLKHSKPADEGKRSSENTCRCSRPNGKQNLKQTSTFVNHAANAWHENRKKWVGDKAQHSPRTPKDPIIRYTSIQLPFFSFTAVSIVVNTNDGRFEWFSSSVFI